MRRRNRTLFAAFVAVVAGVAAYINPAIRIERHVARDEVAVKAEFRLLSLDWDQAPVARAMLSITQ
ncbi:hypothetical protein [Sphingomonas sp.]|uniref:hypothetical protein n=1 Tax=Sphingomonas sp. TaxID=28214 RepID=UPI002BEEF4E2|nr:hypothetical protein [Sphingomonas sp.]HWK35743.1 hypothetical protein [Sphingomonas sp.]